MADTVMVRKANVVLEISNDEATVAKYLSIGYDVVGPNGKVIKPSTHGKSESELRVEIESLTKKIDSLTEENKDLKAKLEALVAGIDDEESVEEAPKKTKRTTKSKN